MNSPEKYSLSMRIMHWLMGAMILAAIAIGWFMTGLDSEVSTYKYDLYDAHKAFGALLLIMVIARFILRLVSPIPRLPKTVPSYEKGLSHATHWSIYLFMLLVPLSGYLMSNASGRPISMFGIPMPALIAHDPMLAQQLHEIHIYIPYILLALIAVHLIAVIRHRWFDKPEHDVLKRML